MASGIATRSLLSLSSFAVLSAGGMNIMAIPVVEFSKEGYKIRKIFD